MASNAQKLRLLNKVYKLALTLSRKIKTVNHYINMCKFYWLQPVVWGHNWLFFPRLPLRGYSKRDHLPEFIDTITPPKREKGVSRSDLQVGLTWARRRKNSQKTKKFQTEFCHPYQHEITLHFQKQVLKKKRNNRHSLRLKAWFFFSFFLL